LKFGALVAPFWLVIWISLLLLLFGSAWPPQATGVAKNDHADLNK